MHVTDFPVINVHANELRTSEHCFGLVKPSYYQSEWTSWVKKFFGAYCIKGVGGKNKTDQKVSHDQHTFFSNIG